MYTTNRLNKWKRGNGMWESSAVLQQTKPGTQRLQCVHCCSVPVVQR